MQFIRSAMVVVLTLTALTSGAGVQEKKPIKSGHHRRSDELHWSILALRKKAAELCAILDRRHPDEAREREKIGQQWRRAAE